jgi:hypothetical protein
MAMTLYPDVQRRAQEELNTVLPPGSMPTFADRPQLPYIEAVVREVVRWHPVSPQGMLSILIIEISLDDLIFLPHLVVPHRAMADNVYNGYFIPEGTLLIGNTW